MPVDSHSPSECCCCVYILCTYICVGGLLSIFPFSAINFVCAMNAAHTLSVYIFDFTECTHSRAEPSRAQHAISICIHIIPLCVHELKAYITNSLHRANGARGSKPAAAAVVVVAAVTLCTLQHQNLCITYSSSSSSQGTYIAIAHERIKCVMLQMSQSITVCAGIAVAILLLLLLLLPLVFPIFSALIGSGFSHRSFVCACACVCTWQFPFGSNLWIHDEYPSSV